MTGRNIAALKAVWRRAYLASRRARLTQLRAGGATVALSDMSTELSSLGLDATVGTVAGYQALRSEVDVSPLLRAWTDKGGTALVPTAGAMTSGRYASPHWQVFEGVEGGVAGPSLSSARLILVPGLAFGVDGARLGRGAGWYDRALVKRRSDALVLGVCYENEVVEAGLVPVDDHDVAVHGVIPPGGLRLF